MKIKTWLLTTYLIVMILPLVMAYFLFAWINSYNNDQKVQEFFATSMELTDIKSVLNNPKLYQMKIDRPEVDKLSSEKLSIYLYNPDGFIVYSSNPMYSIQSYTNREKLYENLFSLNQGFRAYSYKQPVFDKNELVGFFQVELARSEWMAGVSERTWFIFGLFITSFLLIYLTVMVFVNKKLNRRLVDLKNEMTAFADGQMFEETATNQDEIGELQRHFYDMRKQINIARDIIEQEQRAKEYMIATISHDLKTPLTSIRAYAESLELNQNLSVQEQSEYRQVIVEKSNFMKQMLDDLLTYTLMQSPSYELAFVQVEGGEFFDMLVSDYEPLCEEKNIHLDAFSDVTGLYKVHPKSMMRVVDNLVSNAIQHTNSRGKIKIATISNTKSQLDWLFNFVQTTYVFKCKEYVYLIVQNTGKGIDLTEINQVFDPLFQADEARNKRNSSGTGLGLSITKQIIEKHGGTVQIFSEKEVGVCVICRLPKIIKEGELIE
ncbi:sensor histidine kinase [Sporosarcina sp. G11-34]|uniref:sensor histidine kinase n=1 Tax=Sporosarcina sp. G11-34 TaxID=2849605 RepID=UPI0022A97841|nr:HAMP domain-containing sensor histidine kinase [Sporosarcina sp. G11-34]MCZ2259431.1 HAMP domain-containing histidine kinase [Sporosarcina sp. G11-34]